jgi:hypothetical protein
VAGEHNTKEHWRENLTRQIDAAHDRIDGGESRRFAMRQHHNPVLFDRHRLPERRQRGDGAQQREQREQQPKLHRLVPRRRIIIIARNIGEQKRGSHHTAVLHREQNGDDAASILAINPRANGRAKEHTRHL